MKILLLGLVGSAVVGMAIGLLIVLPPDEDAGFVAEPPRQRRTTLGDEIRKDIEAHPERYGFNPRAIDPTGMRTETDCSATFTDAATERALMPVYFYSRDGQCEESDAWGRLGETTGSDEYAGATLVTMGTPLSRWLHCESSEPSAGLAAARPGESVTMAVPLPCEWLTDRIR